MFTPAVDLDQPEQVLTYLAPPIRAIHDALDHGASLADSMCNDLPHDPHLWAHLARFGACQYLAGLQLDGWSRGRELPNSGIEVARGPLVLRALKCQDGDPPHPGGNRARRAFWMQGAEQLRLALGVDGVRFPVGANYILDWTVGERRVISLALSKPTGVWKYRGRPKLEWRRPVRITDDDLKFVPPDEDVLVEPTFDSSEFDGSGDAG
jgi:hypothetical protein